MVEEALERWADDPAVRSRHCRRARADPAALWEVAQSIRLADTRRLGRLVRWRIPGTPASLTYHELFSRYPFTVLERGDTWQLSGLCGRIWTLAPDYPRLSGPEAFESWSERGTVKVIFAHWTRPAGDGAELLSEARVTPVGRRAALRLRGLWSVVAPFERLVGAEPLAIAARRAEGRNSPDV
jgi:hypothetical protein